MWTFINFNVLLTELFSAVSQGSVPADAQSEPLLPQLGELGPVGHHHQRGHGQLPHQPPLQPPGVGGAGVPLDVLHQVLQTNQIFL